MLVKCITVVVYYTVVFLVHVGEGARMYVSNVWRTCIVIPTFISFTVERKDVREFYKIGSKLGEGGFGTVYRGTNKQTGEEVNRFGI